VAETLLRVAGVSKTFGGLKAVSRVSLDVPEGSLTALIGPNGAGKTTLFALMSGFIAADEGQIELAGQDITGQAPHLNARLGMARTFQIVQPFAAQTVRENIAVGAHLRHHQRADALAQAEAVADLIAAGSESAARAAMRSLDGEFSRRVDALARQLIELRVYIEAAIDFPEEEIDFLRTDEVRARFAAIDMTLHELLDSARRGRSLRDGLHVVLVGPPNAGKSSLLNALAGSERAIVTELPGTTRDLLQEAIRIDGVELTLVDTAGLREAFDPIEAEGIRRARAELQRADLALVVLDARDPEAGRLAVADEIVGVPQRLWLHNKADLLLMLPGLGDDALAVSAHSGLGLAALHQRLLALSGAGEAIEGAFTARARHVQALADAAAQLDAAAGELRRERLELAAEALAQAHDSLGTIGGRVGADALLGHIFAAFCIGK